ncbi:ABC transporter permease [Virgibacillus dokdonensis]|uniref:ABC transporter permease n=1 Tax=Virgibacillus dokdonensis TaxID=302167 RepID=UPI00098BA2A3|nr:ABC transporter permease [Virgibacillus dokdonensis]
MKNTSFVKLVKTGYLEIMRDFKTAFFIIIFPVTFLIMFGLMGMLIPNSESMELSFIEFMFPGVLIFALLSTGLFGTTTPLIELRKKGTLKLFQVTPLSKGEFLLSQITIRFIISIIQITLFFSVGFIIQVIQLKHLIPFYGASLLGMCLILPLGFIFGSIFNSVEVSGALLGGISAPVLMLSGVLLPLTIFPDIFEKIAMISPFTYFGDLLRTVMFDSFSPMFPAYINILVLFGSTIVLFYIGKVTFKWR